MARCPAHADGTPSLSIRDADDGNVLVRCHAGCDQQRVIAVLHMRGLWTYDRSRPPSHKVRSAPVVHKPDPNDAKRSEAAVAIWESAERAQGTLVEVYIASRGIYLAAPVALRFHPSLKHPRAAAGRRWWLW